MKLSTMSVSVQNNVIYLMLSNPPENKMGALFFSDLSRAINRVIELSGHARGVVIQAEGRHFSTGADIADLTRMMTESTTADCAEPPEWYVTCRRELMALRSLDIPIVSIIKGFCIGSGLEIALLGHYIISSKRAVIGLVESMHQLIPGLYGNYFLQQRIGVWKAFEFILAAKTVSGSVAYQMGIVDGIYQKGEAERLALNYIETHQDSHFLEK